MKNPKYIISGCRTMKQQVGFNPQCIFIPHFNVFETGKDFMK